MNPTVAAALERIKAELPTVTAPAEGDLGYGSDLDCVTDCTSDFRTIGPDTPRIILQRLARRFQTPRGSYRQDRDYGLDLRGALHKGMTQRDLRMLQGQAHGEAKKEVTIDRLQLTLTVSGSAAAAVISVRVHVTPLDPRIAPFAGIIRVSKTSAEVEE